MAVPRDRPYSQFNFLVSFGSEEPVGGFQEVSGLGMEVTVAEYRAGSDATNAVTKITGTYKVPDVTFKRGVIGESDFYDWLKSIRDGAQDDLREVKITLLSEDRSTEVVQWRLLNARPMKYTGPSFNAKGTDVAIEELVLACEDIRYDGEQ